MIVQKCMTFDHYSFFFSSSHFFLGGKRKGEKNKQSRGRKSCLSVGSYKIFEHLTRQIRILNFDTEPNRNKMKFRYLARKLLMI